jgi:ribosomal protein S18 acetylase RimI-like enzyme
MLPDNEIKHRVEVIIREMEIDDLSTVYHLGEKLFTSDEFPILYRTWDPYEVTDYFTTESEYCLVAETEDKKIVGFVLANMIEKEGTAWKKYGYLTWIGVDPEYQRTNLGQRLYNKIEDTFQKEGARMVMADTDAENSGALVFPHARSMSGWPRPCRNTGRKRKMKAAKGNSIYQSSLPPRERLRESDKLERWGSAR